MKLRTSTYRSLPALVAVGLGGRGAAMLVNMIVLAITSRLLPPIAFGEFAICQFVVDFGQAAAAAFLVVPMLQHGRMRGSTYRFIFTLASIIAFCAGVMTFALAPWVADWLAMPGLVHLLMAIAPVLALRTMASFFVGVLQRQVKIRQVVQAQSFSQISSALLITLPLAAIGFDAWSLVIGLAVSTALELLLLAKAVRVKWRFTLAGDLRVLFIAGLPTLLHRLLVFGADSSDRIVVGRLFGGISLGFYSRAASLVRLPLNLLGIPLQSALMAWFSRCQQQSDLARAAIVKSVRIQSFLLPISLALFWLATPVIVRIMLGTKWDAAIPIAQVLFIGSLARLGAIPLESASLVLGHAWSSARRQFAAIFVLVAGILAAVALGTLGIAIAVALSRLTYYLLGLEFGVRHFGISRTEVVTETSRGAFVCAACGSIAIFAAKVMALSGLSLQIGQFALFSLLAVLAILLGPERLVGPTGPFVRAQMLRLIKFTTCIRSAPAKQSPDPK